MTQRNDEEIYLARAVMTLVDTAHRRISATIDLTRMQVLGIIEAEGPIRPGEIAEQLKMTKSAVSRHLSALHGAAQIVVEPDARDARTFLVTISDQGAAETRIASAAGARRFAQAIADWSDDDIVTARRSIERLLDSWAKPLAPPVARSNTTQARYMRRQIEGGPVT